MSAIGQSGHATRHQSARSRRQQLPRMPILITAGAGLLHQNDGCAWGSAYIQRQESKRDSLGHRHDGIQQL